MTKYTTQAALILVLEAALLATSGLIVWTHVVNIVFVMVPLAISLVLYGLNMIVVAEIAWGYTHGRVERNGLIMGLLTLSLPAIYWILNIARL